MVKRNTISNSEQKKDFVIDKEKSNKYKRKEKNKLKKMVKRNTISNSKPKENFVIDDEKSIKYKRGNKVKLMLTKDRRLKSNLKMLEKKNEEAIKQATRSEILQVEETGYLEADDNENTYEYQQSEIADSVDISSAQKYFNLNLEQFGPYKINYTKNGKFLLIGGQKGHLSSIEWQNKNLACEVHAGEVVRDVKWLHQETFFAAAQKKYVFIYDNQGTEIHRLKQHREVNRLEYLPYHFLLATVGNCGFLKYQDTSTGKLVSELRTKLGRCDCMAQNPYNAIINLGHYNGCVTMWSPTVKEPLVKMLCHRGPVLSIAVEKKGVYMATSGLDGLIKVWDIRNYKSVYKYRLRGKPAQSLAISQKGMLAVAFGSKIHVFRNALMEMQHTPYLTHMLPGADATSVQFCPYEDVLGIGHMKGFTSLIIPGSGEANFDAMEANPFETKAQRREHEVKMLLEKIQPEMISLNPSDILRIDTADAQTKKLENDEAKVVETFEPKFKLKGRSSTSKVVQRKKGVSEVSKRDQLKQKMLDNKRKERQNIESKSDKSPENVSALDRFIKKPSV
ncbi:uncharacterized protein LOC100201145 isoform X4 [Hydra vulgaris]|uniref:Uncharacterized protein LOC100201145 isoform X4 n=1 Tax=Hydra vulgaris TaxID=6087 RepID=A0ABM4BCC2_HYDVU